MFARVIASARLLLGRIFRPSITLGLVSAIGGAALIFLLTGMPAATSSALGMTAIQNPAKGRLAAPDLIGGVDWLNTDKPISLANLRGRIVVLDFWTLCCINCIHTLPDLAKLEARYPGVLVVIGIHSPKFDNEKKSESITKAVLRYEIKHPVINDADLKLWKTYGIKTWPTLVVIDPDGGVVWAFQGEGNYQNLDALIGKLVKEYKAKGTLKSTPLPFKLAREKDHGPLYFPGKVLADAGSQRLFIADSTNHRIVITTLDGKKIAVAGAGIAGKKDGKFADARFSDPQGLALDGDTLYVADRRNHCIRALDLKEETVRTVAGNGIQEHYPTRAKGGFGVKTPLNSPWDLLNVNKKIYVAMAGHHQIWVYDPAKLRIDPYAGDGHENLKDGLLSKASFAQPSGLASDGKRLFVADSEISAIRAVALPGFKGGVSTIVGEGLFEFGDKNGQGNQVRLQHALGVAYLDGQLYVADTYNSKIKIIDPILRTCETYLGEANAKTFNEPGGLSIAGGKMYVADTNNHRIQVVDMKTKEVTPLQLQDVEPVRRENVAGKETR